MGNEFKNKEYTGGKGTDVPIATREPIPTGASPEERKIVRTSNILKEMLVDNYIQRKNAADFETKWKRADAAGSPAEEAEGSKEKGEEKKAPEGLDVGSLISGLTGKGSESKEGSEEPKEKDEEKSESAEGEKEPEAKKEDKKEDKDKSDSGMKDLFATGSEIMKDGLAIASNRQKRKDSLHNNRKQRELTRSNWISGLSGFSHLAKLGLNINGWFSKDKKNEKAQKADLALGAISSGFSALSSAAGWFNSYKTNKEHGQVAEAAQALHDKVSDKDDAAQKESMSKADYKAFKAKKYALGQASAFHANRKNQYSKGKATAVANIITSGLSVASSFFKNSTLGKIVSGIAPIASAIGGAVEKYQSAKSDKKLAEDDQKAKDKEMKDYLAKKRKKIDDDAGSELQKVEHSLTLPDQDQEEMVKLQAKKSILEELDDDQKDRIALARIGVNTTIDKKPLTEGELDAGFEILTHKRARLILDSSEKVAILSSLQLDKNATEDEVAKALKGE